MLKPEPLQEALRLFPPGHISIREAVEDLDLDGHFVPKGTWDACEACLTHSRCSELYTWQPCSGSHPGTRYTQTMK